MAVTSSFAYKKREKALKTSAYSMSGGDSNKEPHQYGNVKGKY
jgi:hypothetical protein